LPVQQMIVEQTTGQPDRLIPDRLTPERVLDLWSKTYNTDGKPDWSHLFPYYHPDIVFQDSIQKVEGREKFMAMCNRLSRRCQHLQMDIHSIAQVDNQILMDWTMTMSFRRSPSTPVFGCTKLTLHDDGRIARQRDYFDLWGDIFNGIPGFRRLYRSMMRRFFG
jgi:limonene-1,2-epoxide hydrolase